MLSQSLYKVNSDVDISSTVLGISIQTVYWCCLKLYSSRNLKTNRIL